MVTSISPVQGVSFPASAVGNSGAAVSPENSVPPPAKSQSTPRQGNRPLRADLPPDAGTDQNRATVEQAATSYQTPSSPVTSSTQANSATVDLSV